MSAAPHRMPSRADGESAAAAVATYTAAGGRLAVPYARWVAPLRRAGWVREVPATVTHAHPGTNRDVTRRYDVAAVPLAWLAELARRLGVPWDVACRYEVTGT